MLTSTFTERYAALIFFGNTGVLNVRTLVFVCLNAPFLRTLILRTCMIPSLFRLSSISSSVQGPKSWHRMTPLEVFNVLCNEILTLRSNNFLVASKAVTCAFFSTSKRRSPDFSLFILFGCPAID